MCNVEALCFRRPPFEALSILAEAIQFFVL